MKKDNQILIGLGIVAVMIYAFRDKIFKPKAIHPSVPASEKASTLSNTANNTTALDAAIKAKYGANYTPKYSDSVVVNGTMYKYAPYKCGFEPPENAKVMPMDAWYDWSCSPLGALR